MAGNRLSEFINDQSEAGKKHRRNLLGFLYTAVVWIGLDMATKQYFNSLYEPGDVISESILGIFRFKLVHNTGAAWGLFGDSTFFLGIMSTIVCILLLFYFISTSARSNLGEVVGLALVFGGGIGNAIDRFSLGYVVDFIDFTFIDFPVFNIADMGVTCGFVIFIISMIVMWIKAGSQRREEEALKAAALGDSTKENADQFDATVDSDDTKGS